MAATEDVLDPGQAGSRYVRGGGLRALAYLGAVTASIAATPLITRHLHSVDYGRYVTVTSLLLIIAALTEGGIANLGVREFSSDADSGRRELMRSLIGVRIALSVLGGCAAIAFAAIAGYAHVVIAGTAVAAVGLVLANLQVTLAVPLTARLRLPWLAALDFLGPAITAGVLVALVAGGASLLPFYGAALAGYLVTLTLTALLVRHEITLKPAFDLRRWRALLRESVVFAAATALGAIYFQVVVVAMSLLTDGHQVGIFSLAFRVISVVNGIPLLLVGSAFPILLRAASSDRKRLRDAVTRLVEGSLMLGGWLSLLVVSGAPFAVRVLGGSGYAGSTTVLRIVGAGVVATFLASVFAFSLLALGSYRFLIAMNACMVALAVALCSVLVPIDGARGAGLSTLSLEVVLATSYGVGLLRRNPDLRPAVGRAARTLVALGAAFVVALVPPFSPILAAVAGSIVLAVTAGLLRVYPRELFDLLVPGSRLGVKL
jgi:O-antigen/teichoic acid export membrane protein